MNDIVSIITESKKLLAQGSPKNIEAIPSEECGFAIPAHIRLLHLFAEKNPIYYKSYPAEASKVPIVVYEADFNRYWLNSILHKNSKAPFSPTWVASAYVAVSVARSLGFQQIVDVGSGDGRIAYCARVLGLDSYSIELDEMLVELQQMISQSTGVGFSTVCADAMDVDYSKLNLSRPIFFIGGLAQMGGDALANSIIKKISGVLPRAGMALVGTYSEKYTPDPLNLGGWGNTIRSNGMDVLKTVVLPTAWTLREENDAPYIYARLG